jgi:Legume lectin domain/Chitobiase/beta-hexosaminidase C-terminal domain
VVPADTFTTSWPVNIPTAVGGNTAYAGFTGGTGGLTATQQILNWTFSNGTQPPAATPVIAPATGTYTTAQTVSITDGTAGFTIYYTLDGSIPTSGSTKYAGMFNVTTTTTVRAMATAPGFAPSATATSVVTIQSGGTVAINFGSGFSAAGMQLNGNSQLVGKNLQLTDGTTTSEDSSAYWTTPVNVQSFTSDFTFQLTNANADGFTFVLQNKGLTGLGAVGGGLGYSGLATSVAVKFDLYNNVGEGTNSTGLYTGGSSPTLPATTLGGGVNLHSGDTLHAHITYDGTTLTLTISDLVVPADTFTTSWPVNIPTAVGGNTAYAGFTGATGGLTAVQQILTWTYSH